MLKNLKEEYGDIVNKKRHKDFHDEDESGSEELDCEVEDHEEL